MADKTDAAAAAATATAKVVSLNLIWVFRMYCYICVFFLNEFSHRHSCLKILICSHKLSTIPLRVSFCFRFFVVTRLEAIEYLLSLHQYSPIEI